MKYIIGAVLLVAAIWFGTSYNGLVNSEENVGVSYSQIQNQLNRQAELIPNLVKIVGQYAKHEKSTLVGLSEARAGVTAVGKIDPTKLANDPALQKQLIEAQASMNAALLKFTSTVENYPQLKADAQFDKLFSEVAGSQNRITVARMDNQNTVNAYNKQVRQLPGKWVAVIAGFEPKPYYEASAAAQTAPEIKFDE